MKDKEIYGNERKRDLHEWKIKRFTGMKEKEIYVNERKRDLREWKKKEIYVNER